MDRLKEKVALISGGARGQGAAEARLFVREGARVVIGDVLDPQARELADEINHQAGSRSGSRAALAIHLDVTRAADWRAALDACEHEFGGLDSLINNAGILNFSRIEDTSEEEWDSVVAVNQKGVWLGMKTAVPAMRKRGGGSIVNISSIYGIIGSAGAPRHHWPQGPVRVLSKVRPARSSSGRIRLNTGP